MRIRALLFCLLLLIGYAAAQTTNQETNFASGPQYLLTGSPLLAHSIATPSVSLDAPLPPIEPGSVAIPSVDRGVPYSPNPLTEGHANLIPIYYGEPNYYGVPDASVVEISFPEGAAGQVAALPSSIGESGVTQFVDPQNLEVRGYGIPLGDVAAYWKAQRPSARRSYSNDDLKRLHPAGY